MRRKDFTIQEKATVLHFLLEGSKDGRLARGRREAAVIKFSSSTRTISRMWAAAQKQKANGEAMVLLNGKNNPRKKRVACDTIFIKSLDFHKRSTIRSLAERVGCSESTVVRWIRSKQIRAHTSPLRPDLTAPNKLLRLTFSLEALEVDRVMNVLRFKSMHNTVHIDEKWFYITKGVHRFYLTPDEVEPHRTCKSKHFVTKVMFMCAVARPIFGPDGAVIFYGKIGSFPLTYQEPAKRDSKNRPAGTMITKAIDAVNKQVVRDYLINKIIPAIRAKWPPMSGKHVFIQQDNAKPHIQDDDPEFRAASSDDDFTFTLVQQPPNSPDTNVLDLGWFAAIQALQQKTVCQTIDELVAAVQQSFEDLTAVKLNNVFLSLQGCMVEIIKANGANRYKQPHLGKQALIRQGNLPLNLEVPTSLAREALMHLLESGEEDDAEKIWDTLGFEPAYEGDA